MKPAFSRICGKLFSWRVACPSSSISPFLFAHHDDEGHPPCRETSRNQTETFKSANAEAPRALT